MEIWTFEAVAPGHVSMGFDYRRPWESVQPAKRHAVAVTVDR
ncbi:MAG: protease inhibitor I42 family protein [Chloroflexota bacterium]